MAMDTTNTMAHTQGLRTFAFSLRRLACNKLTRRNRLTENALNTVTTAKISAKQPIVDKNADCENTNW